MEHMRAEGAIQNAIILGQRLLALDPLQETVHRALMELYGELGQRLAALQQYHRCRELLASELGVEPETETEALHQALRNENNARRDVAEIAEPDTVGRKESADSDRRDERSDDGGPPSPPSAIARMLRDPKRWALAAGLLLVIGGATALGWLQPWAPSVEPASLDRMAYPLPDKPSIAVLPFANLSGDLEQDFFVDGITDDIITEISRLGDLFVISRNSTFVYKDKAVEIRQVAEDLGVRYVLEGSVRQIDDRIRINAQLIDAVTGTHVWAERYYEALTDIFVLQDKVTERVALALAGQIATERWIHQARQEANSLEAYQAFLRAKRLSRLPDGYTIENFASRIHHLNQALELDPNYARAHAQLGGAYWEIANEGWETSFAMTKDEAIEKATHHLGLASQYPTREYHFFMAKFHHGEGRFDMAIAEARKMIALNKNDVLAYKALGRALNFAGRSAETIELIKRALRLDPRGDDQGWLSYRLGEALYMSGREEEAVEYFERSAERNQNEWSYFYLAAVYGQTGRLEEAREALEQNNILRAEVGNDPFTIAEIGTWNYKRRKDMERVQDGLRKAGMPEGLSTTLRSNSADDVLPTEVEGAKTIDGVMAKSLFDRGVPFIDVRSSVYWAAGHVPGALNLDLFEEFTEDKVSKIAIKDKDLVIIAHGATVSSRSARASARAVQWGFTKVYFFRDGFAGWKSAGYPVATGK
jgi:TolB-like protein/Flp pilus assembly protein TadD/rhodanese-related sulfurtransferase